MKVYLVRHEEREQYIGLIAHKDYIFPTKELAVQFCLDNSKYKDEEWIQDDTYMRMKSDSGVTQVLVIEEKKLHRSIPDIEELWRG